MSRKHNAGGGATCQRVIDSGGLCLYRESDSSAGLVHSKRHTCAFYVWSREASENVQHVLYKAKQHLKHALKNRASKPASISTFTISELLITVMTHGEKKWSYKCDILNQDFNSKHHRSEESEHLFLLVMTIQILEQLSFYQRHSRTAGWLLFIAG